MALSAKMLAVVRKVDAAHAEFLIALHASAKQDAQVRVERKKQQLTNAKKKPPMKLPLLRAASRGGSTRTPRKDRSQIPKPRG